MPQGTPRKKTETHAWCCKCETMVPHEDYNKNQAVCRECQRRRARDRYSKGRTCARCKTAPISDYAPGDYCRKCSWKNKQDAATPVSKPGPGKYVIISRLHNHPNADRRGRIYEHVYVMSQMLGRPLQVGENVHHINGIRNDNRPENLELWAIGQPRGQRISDKVAWAKEILAMYEPTSLCRCHERSKSA